MFYGFARNLNTLESFHLAALRQRDNQCVAFIQKIRSDLLQYNSASTIPHDAGVYLGPLLLAVKNPGQAIRQLYQLATGREESPELLGALYVGKLDEEQVFAYLVRGQDDILEECATYDESPATWTTTKVEVATIVSQDDVIEGSNRALIVRYLESPSWFKGEDVVTD